MQIICKNTYDQYRCNGQQNYNLSDRFLFLLFRPKTLLLPNPEPESESWEYNIDTSRYVLQEDHEKYEILLSAQRTRIPSDSQLQSGICAFFMYYMSSQINHPGTVHSQINTATTLICQISHKNIFRSHLPAEISQQHTYQNHSI